MLDKHQGKVTLYLQRTWGDIHCTTNLFIHIHKVNKFYF
jgi:hypothetical protein